MVSETAGFTKPDSRIFEIALEKLCVEPSDAVMIGDSWEEDILGAYKAGIRAVWFNRKGKPVPDKKIAVEIKSFIPASDVMKLIFGSP